MKQRYRTIETSGLPAPIYIFDEVGSTFETARELAAEKIMPVWASVLAKSQLQGRGQLRREWVSPLNNLYATICLPADKIFTELTSSAFTGTMFVAAMRQLGLNVFLKWPNDIVMGNGEKVYKVGGILIEENAGTTWAGIGINIYNSPKQDQLRKGHALPTTHMAKYMDYFNNSANLDLKIQDFWCSLVKEIFSWYSAFSTSDLPWQNIANSFLLWNGQNVSFLIDQQNIQGILLGISAKGGIYIEDNGIKKEYFNGSLLPI